MVLTTLQSLSGTYQGCHHTIKPDFAPPPSLQGAFYMTLSHFRLSTIGNPSNSLTGVFDSIKFWNKSVINHHRAHQNNPSRIFPDHGKPARSPPSSPDRISLGASLCHLGYGSSTTELLYRKQPEQPLNDGELVC